MKNNTSKLYPVKQAIKKMGIGRTSFYDEVKKNKIILKKYGRKSLVSSDQIENWINSLPEIKNVGGEK